MDINIKIYFSTLSLLALLLIYLSVNVIRLRRTFMVLYGAKGHIMLKAAIRAQANFTEYVPIIFLLFAGLIYFNINNWLFACLCLVLIISRISHAMGLLKFESYEPPILKPRFYGMLGTFASILFSIGYIITCIVIK